MTENSLHDHGQETTAGEGQRAPPRKRFQKKEGKVLSWIKELQNFSWKIIMCLSNIAIPREWKEINNVSESHAYELKLES